MEGIHSLYLPRLITWEDGEQASSWIETATLNSTKSLAFRLRCSQLLLADGLQRMLQCLFIL